MSASERQDTVQSSNVNVDVAPKVRNGVAPKVRNSNFTRDDDRGGQIDVDKQENISSPKARMRSFGRAIASVSVALIAGLGMLPFLGSTAFAAGTSVMNVSGPAPSPSSAGAPAVYTIGFTTSSTGALTSGSGTITLTAPSGTSFPSSDGDYSVGGTLVSATPSLSNSNATVTITTPVAVNDSQSVSVVINGVTNPPAGTYTMQVSTSSDTVPASTGTYAISTGISGLTVTPTNPVNSNQNPTPTSYTITFDTSSTGVLTAPTVSSGPTPSAGDPSATSSITLEAPSGTSLPTTAASYLVNGVGSVNYIGSTVAPEVGATANIETIGIPVAIAGSTKVTVTVLGVTNPATAGPNIWTAYTSADAGPVTSSQFQVTAQVSSPTASISTTAPSTDAAGKSGNYTFGFTAAPSSDFTTASDANVPAGTGTITLSTPTGTVLPSANSAYVINDTFSGHTFTAVASSVTGGGSDSATIITPDEIYAGDTVTVTVAGVTNPTPTSQTATTSNTADISTSADATPATTGAYDVYTQPANVTITPSNTLTTTSANTQTSNYTITFDASAIGSLSSGNTITVTAPIAITSNAGTEPTIFTNFATIDGIVASASATAQASLTSPANVVITVPLGVSVGDGQGVTLVLAGVTNPTTSGSLQMQVATSTDQVPAAGGYSLSAPSGSQVTGVSVSVSPATSSSSSTYTVDFTTSAASGGLPQGDTVTLVAPPGTALPSTCSDYTTSATCFSVAVQAVNGSSTANEAVITTGTAVSASTLVSIAIASSTNPAVAGDYAWTVSTQVDTLPVTSNYYLIGSPATSVGTPSVSLTSNVPGSAAYTVTFVATHAFSSSEDITMTATTPPTTLPCAQNDYTIDGVKVPATPTSVTGGCVVETPVDIAAGSTVTVVINGATNVNSGSTPLTGTIDVSTAADTVAVASNGYTVYPAPTAVVSASVSSGFPAPNIASETAQYQVVVKVTTALSGSSSPAGTVTLDASTGAQGTVFPNSRSDYTIAGIQVAGVSLSNSGQTVTLTLPSSVSVAANGTLTVVANGVTNPSTAGLYDLAVSTSADQSPVTTSTYPIYTGVTGVSGPSPDTDGYSDPSIYTLNFTTTNALASPDTIGVIDPTGKTAFTVGTAYVNGVSTTTALSSGAGCAPGSNAPSTSKCIVVTVPVGLGTIAADSPVSVYLPAADVSNPSATGTNYVLDVATTTDEALVPTSTYTIATPPTQVTVAPNAVTVSPNLAGNPGQYTVKFTTSGTGSLAAGTGTITLDAPSGTVFPSATSDYIINNQVAAAVSGGGTDTVTVTTAVAIGTSASVTLIADGVTNSSPGSYEMGISTSSDTAEVKSSDTAFDIVAPPAPTVSAVSPTSGYTTGGTSVTITGTNLTGATTVDFGAVAAKSFTVVSATSITAVTAAESAGTVNVTVTTAGGTSATSSADDFTFVAPPAPTVTAISPTSGPTTGGTSVTITGTNFASGATVDFGTVAGTGVSVVSATSITVTSPAQVTGTVNVTVTVNGVTSAISSADQFTYEATYTAISPTRICDTRAGNPSNLSGAAAQCNGKTLSANTPLDVTVAGIAGVPSTGVSAVVLNVTAVNEAGGGYVTVYPAGAKQPATSNLNFTTGQATANLIQVGVGSNDQVSIVSNTATDVIVDLEGYYSVPASPGQGLYNGLTPARICDTRSGNPSNLSGGDAQCNGKTLSVNTPLTVQVAGNGGVPSTGVTAVALNLTAVGYTKPGYLTAYPSGLSSAPTASNVNFAPGEGAVPNRVIVPVSSTGAIDVVSNVATNVLVDVSGYFTAASSSATGSQFNAEASPVRIVDTRCSASPAPSFCSSESIPGANQTLGTLGAGKSITVQVAGLAGVPISATAVVVNVTATNTTANGFLSVNPAATPPSTSDLNWMFKETVANLVIAKLSSTGTITIYNNSGSADVIVDVMGWYM